MSSKSLPAAGGEDALLYLEQLHIYICICFSLKGQHTGLQSIGPVLVGAGKMYLLQCVTTKH